MQNQYELPSMLYTLYSHSYNKKLTIPGVQNHEFGDK